MRCELLTSLLSRTVQNLFYFHSELDERPPGVTGWNFFLHRGSLAELRLKISVLSHQSTGKSECHQFRINVRNCYLKAFCILDQSIIPLGLHHFSDPPWPPVIFSILLTPCVCTGGLYNYQCVAFLQWNQLLMSLFGWRLRGQRESQNQLKALECGTTSSITVWSEISCRWLSSNIALISSPAVSSFIILNNLYAAVLRSHRGDLACLGYKATFRNKTSVANTVWRGGTHVSK